MCSFSSFPAPLRPLLKKTLRTAAALDTALARGRGIGPANGRYNAQKERLRAACAQHGIDFAVAFRAVNEATGVG